MPKTYASSKTSLNGLVTSVTGTTNRISVTGTATAPVIDISAAYVGQTSITTLGTIATGTWSGTTISTTKGGTGLTSYVSGDILYASSSNVLSALAKGSDGQVLKLASGIPSWASVASGLTGTTGDLISFSSTNTAANISAVATGSLFASAGTGTLPVWSASPSLTTSLTVPLVNGGTGTTSSLTYKTTTGTGTTGADHIWVGGTNGATEFMRILNSGFVGIGTNNPAYLLDVVKNQNAVTRIHVANNNTGNSSYAIANMSGATGDIYFGVTRGAELGNAAGTEIGYFKSNAVPIYIGTFDSQPIVFSTSNTEKMRLLSGGNLGIGVVSPTAYLHIKAGTATASTAPIKLTAGTLLSSPEAGTIEYVTGGFVLQGDMLGIGITPVEKLDVNGNFKMRGITSYTNNTNTVEFLRITPDATRTTFSLVNGICNFSAGKIGIEITTPTAALHIKAGTATASTAPLKFSSGTLLTSPEAGAVEFLTDKFYGTITTGAARAEFTLNNAALTSGTFPIATTNGRLTDSGFTSSSLVSGTNTPTATNVTNITSSTPNNTTYIRVGNIVTVDGSITVTNTLAVASEVDVSLPVASNLAAATDLNGIATMDSTASVNIYIKGDVTNDRASIFFTSAGVGQTSTIYYSFSYKVI